MESMVKYVLLMMLLMVFAIASNTEKKSVSYTAVMGDVQLSSKCTSVVDKENIVAIPSGEWTGDCVYAQIKCSPGLDACGDLSIEYLGVHVGNAISKDTTYVDDGHTIIIPSLGFQAIAASGSSKIKINFITDN